MSTKGQELDGLIARAVTDALPFTEMVLPSGRFARIVKGLTGEDLAVVTSHFEKEPWIGFMIRGALLEQPDGTFMPPLRKEIMEMSIHDAVALNKAINKLLPKP